MHTLENEWLKVSVNDWGAELCSIYDKKAEREVIWTADPAFWNRHAPVLFPFVGKVTGGFYTYDGQKYPMGQHGFARDREFLFVKQDETEICHRLVSDETSKKIYPFDFELEIVHKLEGKCVTVEWKVLNPGTKTLYFSIGGHPGFCVEENVGSRLVFEGQTSLKRVAIDPKTEGVDIEHPEAIVLEDGVYQVKADTFDRDALIFDQEQVKQVSLEKANGTRLVTLRCSEALSVGIWSPVGKQAPFICLEPWIGRCDNSGFTGELKDKFDVQSLEAGKSFHTSYELLIGE
ncbi:MAG: aldose 1-epimerase family protein [Lachnospiraceae bacterium]|nr:aldose 1-epimerase family protein [Lachnospiraceae bacterium]